MPLNHYVTLGNSGLRVSPFSLGTMTFGKQWAFGSTDEEASAILRRFIEAGGNFVDTANFYTKGNSELLIGDFISKEKTRRDSLVLATKFFGNLYPGDPNAGGTSRKSIMAACEQSLKRLKTDYIDLYWMHCWDRLTPIEETMSALNDLVRDGKVRYIGFSDTPAWKTAQAQTVAIFRGWAPLIALQIEYSLLERTVEGELMPMARELGLGVTPWSPLKFGILSGKYTRENAGKVDITRGDWVKSNLNETAYKVIDELVSISKEVNSTPARVALAWLLRQPGVTSPIIGARTLQQLEDNIEALELKLDPKHIATLNAVSKPSLNFPHDFVQTNGSWGWGGCTVNGQSHEPMFLAPKNQDELVVREEAAVKG
ncbi:MAG: aldo/keto reductase [Candidatus Obscuribacterales bacterium]|nr:aldo/keto reductase [Candidatus Obscuribacterales bacterium]